MKYPEIENIAESLILYNTEIPIVKIVRKEGFEVFTQDLPEDFAGYILVNGNKKHLKELKKLGIDADKVFVVNENDGTKEGRFTLAKELGYYTLNAKDDVKGINRVEYCKVVHYYEEDEIYEHFAEVLLMPKDLFTKQYEKYTKKENIHQRTDIIQKLSDDFCVPRKAVNERLKALGLNP